MKRLVPTAPRPQVVRATLPALATAFLDPLEDFVSRTRLLRLQPIATRTNTRYDTSLPKKDHKLRCRRREPRIVSEPQLPAPTSTFGKQEFFGPARNSWRELDLSMTDGDDEEKKSRQALAKIAKDELKSLLLSSLQMQHVVVLAGSGTSLGGTTKGPSMWNLWDYCVNKSPGNANEAHQMSDAANAVVNKIRFDSAIEKDNIEALLSRCEAYLQINVDEEVSAFLSNSKKVILEKCSEFLDPTNEAQLAAHRTFLHRLSRRRVRDSRLKLFTTNYDLCFENAASKQGIVAIDGFSFTQPRTFDPRFFLYEIVRRPANAADMGTPLEGVFHLYKLHGSVNWSRTTTTTDESIVIDEKPGPSHACLIYPAKGKYQQSYLQPHLELISQYFSALREPNTCLIVTGFGFNDDHLSEPILAAVRTNPHLRLIIANPEAKALTASGNTNKFWQSLMALSKQGEDVWLINATFGDFSEMIPDLKTLTPAQRLTRDIKQITDSK